MLRSIRPPWRLSTYLIVIVLVAVIPFLILSTVVVNRLIAAKQETSDRYLARAADEVALAFDQEIVATVRTLQAMSMSASLRSSDLRTFHGVITRVLTTQPSWGSVLLHDTNLNWLLNARAPFGTVLGPPPQPESILRVVETGRPVVGDIIKIPPRDDATGLYGFAVRVPVFGRDGKIQYVLSAILGTDAVQALVSRYRSAPDEIARAIVDTKGTLGARSRDPQIFVGGPASATLRDLLSTGRESGIEETRTLEGVPSMTAFRRAPFSGWYAALAVPTEVFTAQAAQTKKVILSLAVILVLFSTCATLLFSAWLRKAISAGAASAADLARGDQPRIKTSRIQEMEELRASLTRASGLLRSREKAKSDFLANMSHELRTPLGIVLGMTELIARGDVAPDEQNKIWEIVKRNGRQLSRLIDDILDFSKVEADRLTIESIDFSLRDLMSSIIEDFGAGAREKNLSLKMIFEDGSPDLVNSDPVRVRQILVNLVGNAVKFTPHGSVELRLFRSEGHTIRLCVSDTGIGLTAAQQTNLFSDFTQGDSSHTRKYGGTGLGLSLSRKLARRLGGDVRLLRSEPDHGSDFEVTLEANALPSEIVRGAPKRDAASAPLAANRKKRILLAEDSPDNVMLVKSYLKKSDVEVRVATNGLEAAELATTEAFDLILMDIQMPELDGFQATRRLRENAVQTPIVALTAHALSDHRDQAMASGFNDYLTKPLRKDALLEILSRYLT